MRTSFRLLINPDRPGDGEERWAIREQGDEVRVTQAERLDAAASATWPRMMDGDLRAQDTWVRNRSRYATLPGRDVRDAGTPLVSGPVSINVVPPWEARAGASVVQHEDVQTLPAPDAYPEPPFA